MKPVEIHKILVEKEKAFNTDYICEFEKQWYEAVERLQRSKVNLAKINIVCKTKR